MASPRPLLLLALLACVVLADQESCMGRCTEGFNADRKCQCDELCSYYQSCCEDYVTECKPQVTRGDVFTLPEDEYGATDYPEGSRGSVLTQQESTMLTPGLQTQREESPAQGDSTGSTSSSSNPVRRSVKAAPCLPCLNTLPCCRGTAGRPSSSFSSGADPLVVLDSPGSSARTGLVCPRRWMRPWPAASTSRAQLPDPGPRSPSLSGVAVSATVHAVTVTVTVAEAAARTPSGNPVQPGCPGSPVRRAAWAPTTMMTTTWTGLCLPPASPSKVFTSSHETSTTESTFVHGEWTL